MEEKKISAGVAKAAFRELLDRVEQGETIIIERHGKATAVLGPVKLNGGLANEKRDQGEMQASNTLVKHP